MIMRAMVSLLLWTAVVSGGGRGRGRGRGRWPTRDVSTRMGTVRGYLAGRYFAFLGLPYARPPTIRDRFKAPEPPPAWDGIFEATHRVKCPQGDEGEEHCLVVNVFMPEQAAACCPQPVLVLVHDGGFQHGWGPHDPPPASFDDFIVVTFNYRIGALGFLCLGTPDVPGNTGLKDQLAALHWIKKNIDSFAGNPFDVTLYGIGSGAESIELLLLSGRTKGLIHRAILESGSVLSPASMTYDPFSTALRAAISLGYINNGNVADLVEFYQNLATNDIVNIKEIFLPCVENNFYYSYSLIEKDPLEILKSGEYDKVPLLIAYSNAQELSFIEENIEKFEVVPEYFEDLLPHNLKFDSENTRIRIGDITKSFYFDEKDAEPNEKTVENYKEYINDVFMEYPVVKFATLYAENNVKPVFLMNFLYDTGAEGNNKGDVLSYFHVVDRKETPDIATAQKLLTLWKNFIKIDDPTPLTTSLVPLVWQPLSGQPDGVIHISKVSGLLFDRTLKMQVLPSSQRLGFWDQIYSKFYKTHSFDRRDD